MISEVAATRFLRRSAGCVLQEAWVLTRGQSLWSVIGGGGSRGGHDAGLLTDRPLLAGTRLPSSLP